MDFYRARQDPFYEQYVVADEEKMADRSSFTWTVGWEEVYVKNGQCVSLPYGDTNVSGDMGPVGST